MKNYFFTALVLTVLVNLNAQNRTFEVVGDTMTSLLIATESPRGNSELIFSDRTDLRDNLNGRMSFVYDHPEENVSRLYLSAGIFEEVVFSINNYDPEFDLFVPFNQYEDIYLRNLRSSSPGLLAIDTSGRIFKANTIEKYYIIEGDEIFGETGVIKEFNIGSARGIDGSNEVIRANINLPDGAIVEEVCANLFVDESDVFINASLISRSFLNQTELQRSDISFFSTSNNGWRLRCHSSDSLTIDNSSNSYFLQFSVQGQNWSSNIKVGMMRIKYR